MARQTSRLNNLSVTHAKKRGYLADGGGLYLQVSAKGAKSWVFRYRTGRKLREMGLGPYPTVSLADARTLAGECRKLRLRGIDPIEDRRAERERAKLAAAEAMTFRQCAERYIEAHEVSWRNAKHRAQWRSTLETYCYPSFGDRSVAALDTSGVVKVLDPLWTAKPETASRLRGRIEAVLDWATARSFRHGDNPARWRGHLDKLLPPPARVRKVQHHPALPYTEMGAFMAQLREQEGMSALALELLILTAARTSEVIQATWAEFDLDAAVWIIPAERMKAKKEHRVPLSAPAVSLLQRLQDVQTGDYVFSGVKPGKPLSNMAMLKLLERMGRSNLTVHGFRSTFRDWAAERGSFPREVAEHALAHSLPDKVEAAYQRGDLFVKRGKLMKAWASFCGTMPASGTVIDLGSRASRAAAEESQAHQFLPKEQSRG